MDSDGIEDGFLFFRKQLAENRHDEKQCENQDWYVDFISCHGLPLSIFELNGKSL
jgi:hypothetical protein